MGETRRFRVPGFAFAAAALSTIALIAGPAAISVPRSFAATATASPQSLPDYQGKMVGNVTLGSPTKPTTLTATPPLPAGTYLITMSVGVAIAAQDQVVCQAEINGVGDGVTGTAGDPGSVPTTGSATITDTRAVKTAQRLAVVCSASTVVSGTYAEDAVINAVPAFHVYSSSGTTTSATTQTSVDVYQGKIINQETVLGTQSNPTRLTVTPSLPAGTYMVTSIVGARITNGDAIVCATDPTGKGNDGVFGTAGDPGSVPTDGTATMTDTFTVTASQTIDVVCNSFGKGTYATEAVVDVVPVNKLATASSTTAESAAESAADGTVGLNVYQGRLVGPAIEFGAQAHPTILASTPALPAGTYLITAMAASVVDTPGWITCFANLAGKTDGVIGFAGDPGTNGNYGTPAVTDTIVVPAGQKLFLSCYSTNSTGSSSGSAIVNAVQVQSAAGLPFIQKVTFSGSAANPVAHVVGTGFGATAPKPSLAEVPKTCGANPSTGGSDYGKTGLWIEDTTKARSWQAGSNLSSTQANCIGLIIKAWSATTVTFSFGSLYGTSAKLRLQAGDGFAVEVEGTLFAGTVAY